MKAACIIPVLTLAMTVVGQSQAWSAKHEAEKPKTEETSPQPPARPIARDFCSSFVDVAAERRLGRINEELNKTRVQLDARIEELKTRSAELKDLIETRKAMQSKVGDAILKIYLQVEPEAAAQQLAKLEPNTAAEILVKMNPKRSGEILSLMDAKKAASLVALLTLQTAPKEEPKS